MSYFKNAIQSFFPAEVEVKCTEDFNERTVRAEIRYIGGYVFYPRLFTHLKDLFGVGDDDLTFTLEGCSMSSYTKDHDVDMILEVTNVTTLPEPAITGSGRTEGLQATRFERKH